jgi:hypothetical protein
MRERLDVLALAVGYLMLVGVALSVAVYLAAEGWYRYGPGGDRGAARS